MGQIKALYNVQRDFLKEAGSRDDRAEGMESVVKLIMLVLRAVLYMFMRYLMSSNPKCQRRRMFMPLGPVKLLFVLFEIDNRT